MKQRFPIGLISGFAYGIAGFFLATLGLVSLVAETLSPLLFPVAIILRNLQLNFPGMLFAAVLINGLVFALFGNALENILRANKKKEVFVAYLFACVCGIVLFLILIEALVRGLRP